MVTFCRCLATIYGGGWGKKISTNDCYVNPFIGDANASKSASDRVGWERDFFYIGRSKQAFVEKDRHTSTLVAVTRRNPSKGYFEMLDVLKRLAFLFIVRSTHGSVSDDDIDVAHFFAYFMGAPRRGQIVKVLRDDAHVGTFSGVGESGSPKGVGTLSGVGQRKTEESSPGVGTSSRVGERSPPKGVGTLSGVGQRTTEKRHLGADQGQIEPGLGTSSGAGERCPPRGVGTSGGVGQQDTTGKTRS